LATAASVIAEGVVKYLYPFPCRVDGGKDAASEWSERGRHGDKVGGGGTIGTRRQNCKYDPLRAYLDRLAGPREQLTFAELEAILGGPLPPSAHRCRTWWGNDTSHSQALAWLDCNWQVEHVDFRDQTVTFVRVPISETGTPD
jgi:hypothetical protein